MLEYETQVVTPQVPMQLTPEQLEHLERQLTAALHALWRARGKRKKIVTIEQQEDG